MKSSVKRQLAVRFCYNMKKCSLCSHDLIYSFFKFFAKNSLTYHIDANIFDINLKFIEMNSE